MKTAANLSVTFCLLATFSCVNALADSVTFSAAASATVTVSSAPDVSVSLGSVFGPNSGSTGAQGNASIVYTSQPSLSFSNQTLSMALASVTGSVSPPPASYLIFGEIYEQTVDITNTNDLPVDLLLTTTFTYALNDTCSPFETICSQVNHGVPLLGSYSSAYLQLLGQPDLTFGANCGSQGGSVDCTTYITSIPGPPVISPMSGTLTQYSTLQIPADSNLSFEVELQSDGSIGSAAPEPTTLALVGSGLLGLVGIIRRRIVQQWVP